MLRGSCLCGEVKYEIDGSLRDVRNCHCSMCRKAHGAAFRTTFAAHPDYYGLPLGGLDDDPGVKPTNHVYVVDKAPWHDITDGLPRHPQGPPT